MLNELEEYAINNNVPIMQSDSINFINKIIKLNNLNSVLEIGTAIGYLSISIAMNNSDVNITTIEKDNLRYLKAIENVNKFKLQDRINLIFNDALNIDIKDNFDLIIIDAAKTKNIEFFNKYKVKLNKNGIIIIDNIDFHNLVGNSDSIQSKNLKRLVQKIEDSIKFLKDQKDFEVKFLKIGDGLALCQKKI